MTSDVVRLDRRGDVAIVTIDNPPVNATGQTVRAGLVRAAQAIAADPEIRGAVLVCAGRTFVAGADIGEFGRPPVAPSLRDVSAAIESLAKPAVAVLHGTALGGGLELALSCHYRLIDPAGAVGLPEVTLGLIPGAGGTQRLPRLIGAAPAIDLIATGRRVTAPEALRLGIVDAVTSGDRLAFAIAFLRERLARPLRRLSDEPFRPAEPADIATARAAVAKKFPGQSAPIRAIDVVTGSAGLDLEAGLALERTVFEELRGSAQAEALRHIFFAERRSAKAPGLGSARPIDCIGVIGGGIMGAGIAAAGLLAGLRVVLVERDEPALRAGRDRLADLLAEAVKRGKLSPDQHADILADRLVAAVEMPALAEADLVIEAVFESLDVKQDVFRALDRVAKPGAVLATNTSYLDVAAIAAVTARPADVIGLHFFSPAHVMKLLEIVVPTSAGPEAVATGFALAKRLGKLGVRTGNAEGFIGNRILSAYRRAADQMVEDGASPYEVDEAFRDFGLPARALRHAGHGRARHRLGHPQALGPDPRSRRALRRDLGPPLRARLARAQDWPRLLPLRRQEPSRRTPRWRISSPKNGDANGHPGTRTFTGAEIQERVLLAAVNEGAKILEAGIALRAGDIDVVMVNGYGFPRWRGGPLHAANAAGLAWVQSRLEALEDGDPLWRIAPIIARLASEGGSF